MLTLKPLLSRFVLGLLASFLPLYPAYSFNYQLAQATIYHQDPWNSNSQLEVDCLAHADGTITCDIKPRGHQWVKTLGIGRWLDNQKLDIDPN